MDDNEVFVMLGQFKAQIETLSTSVAKLESTVDTLTETLSEAKGGWKTLLFFGGISSILGASAHKILEHSLEFFK